MATISKLLTDPFLQLPTADSVRVVWFTEFAGQQHWVNYGENLENSAIGQTTRLRYTREDAQSQVPFDKKPDEGVMFRPIWRHEATITGISEQVPYTVTSINDQGETITSETFTLAPTPAKGKPLKILLTSDHQLMPMTAANLQKVEETVGKVDAVFMGGDLAHIPDRASEWFDDSRGGGFFPVLQGNADYQLQQNETTTRYRGGEIIQHAPIFPAVGNHEVMGCFSMNKPLKQQFHNAVPRSIAKLRVRANNANPNRDPNVEQALIESYSFNLNTYQSLFTLPSTTPYYAVTFGDIRLVVLYITNVWRVPGMSPKRPGRYAERQADLKNPQRWGFGQFIFEPITPGTRQYQWLQQELNRPEFQQAQLKIVMFHHPPHTLGDNIVPAYTDPIQKMEYDEKGKLSAVRYEYPKDQDQIHQYVIPLLKQAGVDLVYYGHSHLWNRFVDDNGIHYLESSNVGNTYGAYWDQQRPVPKSYQEDYVAQGDPYGLEPVMPTLDPLKDEQGNSLPYIASNEITVFSILDTASNTISSYRFDTRYPDSEVIKFDEFVIGKPSTTKNQPVGLVATVIFTLGLITLVIVGL